MRQAAPAPGAAPVGRLCDLEGAEAAAVVYLRLWHSGPEMHPQVIEDFTNTLGPTRGTRAVRALEELCFLCKRHGRRDLICHGITCNCLGADEACFVNFIRCAMAGEHEDAILMATLLVRADFAPLIASLAADFGFALKQMRFGAPRSVFKQTHAMPTRLLH